MVTLNEKQKNDDSGQKFKMVSFRLTKEEFEQVSADMDSIHCLSFSKYMRMLCLHEKLPITKFKYTDKALHKQINDISSKISRIGKNYNQFIKKYNASCERVKKNGDPVINTRATVYYINQLLAQTKEVSEMQEKIIDIVTRIEFNESIK